MKKLISVSFLSSKDAEKDIMKLNASSCDYIHVDVVDGKFAKKKHNPYKLLYKIQSKVKKRLDVHLMDKKPLKNINYYAGLNTEYLTIHVELDKLDKYIELIKEYGIKVGLAINPETDVSALLPYLSKIDLVLVMSVTPGAGGQPFIEETYKKILKIKKMIVSKKVKVKIAVDGGVNDINSKKLDFADILISGSYVTKSDDFEKSINNLRKSSSKKKEVAGGKNET